MLMRIICLCEVTQSVNDPVKTGVKSHSTVLHVNERDVHVSVRVESVCVRYIKVRDLCLSCL